MVNLHVYLCWRRNTESKPDCNHADTRKQVRLFAIPFINLVSLQVIYSLYTLANHFCVYIILCFATEKNRLCLADASIEARWHFTKKLECESKFIFQPIESSFIYTYALDFSLATYFVIKLRPVKDNVWHHHHFLVLVYHRVYH